jgi:hypothetical protein
MSYTPVHAAPFASHFHRPALVLVVCTLAAMGCASEVRQPGDDDDGDVVAPNAPGAEPGGGSSPGGGKGTPCRFLRGEVTLPSRNLDTPDEDYADSLYSFELASNDIDVHSNDGDLLYQQGMLLVNTVTDDRSFIVDLGVLPLDEVPETVDPTDYPTGNWGEHDALGPVLGHTFMVRTIDGNSRQWAAFKVLGLAPKEWITIEWVRSTDPERFVYPAQCSVQ